MVDQLGTTSIKKKVSLSPNRISIRNFALVVKTGEPFPFPCWGDHWRFLLHALCRQTQQGWVHKGGSPDMYKRNVFLHFSGSLARRSFLSHCLWLSPHLGYEVWCRCRSSSWAWTLICFYQLWFSLFVAIYNSQKLHCWDLRPALIYLKETQMILCSFTK